MNEDASKNDPDATLSHDAMSNEGGRVVGRYTLLEEIGAGSFGEVWAARQSEPVKRKVAVKLLKKGMDSKQILARFEQERQALAVMDHPNIAKILDGGIADDGQSYFVMELVNGKPLTRFCDEARLSIRERLELFVAICQAVQHAHQKGVIHRDLKPSNILVTTVDGRPVPKVIDFGLAKAVSGKLIDETLMSRPDPVGTLEYMPPEQAGGSHGDIDTRADLYSLGVILYELLTGLRPFDSRRLRRAALDEMIRVIREEDPPSLASRLSTDDSLAGAAAVRATEPKRLVSTVKGELDWIARRCLEKDRNRRYETANALARDVQRYLADEPVEARPVSAGYRLKKLLRRNKGPVIAAAALLTSLVAGIVTTSSQAYRAKKAEAEAAEQAAKATKNERIANERLEEIKVEQVRTRAEKTRAEDNERKAAASERTANKERDAAVAVKQFLRRDLLNQSPWECWKLLREGKGSRRMNPTFREMLDRAAVRLASPEFDAEWRGRPQLAVEFLTTVADSYQNLGEFERARDLLQSALSRSRRQGGRDETAVVICRCRLAAVSLRSLKPRETVDQAVAILATIEGNITAKGAGAEERFQLGLNQLDALLSTLQQQIADQPLVHLDSIEVAELPALAFPLMRALGSVNSIVGVLEKRLEADDVRVQTLGAFRGFAFEAAEQKDRAMEVYRSSLAAVERSPQRDSVWAMFPRVNVARLNMERGEFGEAAVHFERLSERAERLWGKEHPHWASARSSLGLCLAYTGRGGQAIAILEPLAELMKARLGEEHPDAVTVLANLGVAYRSGGRLKDAIPLLERVRDLRAKSQPNHPEALNDLARLAGAYRAADRLTEAIALFEQVRDARAKQRPNDPDFLYDLSNLGAAYLEAGRLTEAVPLLERAAAGVEKLGFIHDDAGTIMHNTADVLEAAGRSSEAEQWLRKWLDFVKRSAGPQSPEFAVETARLGWNLLQQKNWSAAEATLRESFALGQKTLPDHWTTFDTQSALGAALVGQKKHADAEPLLLKGYEGMNQREKLIPPQVKNQRLSGAVDRLVELYTAANKPDEVKKWQAERAKYPAAKETKPSAAKK
jgi:serine/threonine protein kinase/tetratricopeptide (TPR) repeat protein